MTARWFTSGFAHLCQVNSRLLARSKGVFHTAYRQQARVYPFPSCGGVARSAGVVVVL